MITQLSAEWNQTRDDQLLRAVPTEIITRPEVYAFRLASSLGIQLLNTRTS